MSRDNQSLSSTSCNSLGSVEEVLQNGTPVINTSGTKSRLLFTFQKAKRIRFYHNGNKFFNGIVVPVAPERYRSFDSLINDLTNILMKSVTLPNGVRTIYSMDGQKISCLEDLEDGKEYVCSGKGENFKRIDYSKTNISKTKRIYSPKQNINQPKFSAPDCVRPKIITIIRHGTKPRLIKRLLLNKRNSSSYEQVLSALTEVAQLPSGAVRKVYSISGQQVTILDQFFDSEEVFFVYGNEVVCQDDFELVFEESKNIQQYKKGYGSKIGSKPKMPKKDFNRSANGENIVIVNKDVNGFPSLLKQKYSVGKIIGDGNFAVVRMIRDKINNEEYALKIIDKSKCKGKEDMIDNELKILRKLNHPHVMKLIAEQDTPNTLYLVVELIRGGDLFDAITVVTKFSESQSALMLYHLTSALSYLHNLNIVHRDVKPENLLVDMDGQNVRVLKLGDFGLACEVTEPLYTVCGTPTYVAPEILAESGYGLKIDVWAAGVILYILLCGYPPFVSQDNDQEKLFDCILSGQYDFHVEYWHDISSLAKELIQNMLQLAPEVRFSAEDILDHPWFQEVLYNDAPEDCSNISEVH